MQATLPALLLASAFFMTEAHRPAGSHGGHVLRAHHQPVLLESKVESLQVPGKTTHESFLSRLGNSVVACILGWVLVIFSFPVLWFNESRNAKMESLLARGKQQCRSIKGKADENRNWFVHLEGSHMRSAAEVQDPYFQISFQDNCVRLKSNVEVYQYVQHERKEERETLGGGKETITHYSYTNEWSSVWHDSSYFDDRSKTNQKPNGLLLGAQITSCSRVECGEDFLLPGDLVEQCQNFAPAEERLGERVASREGLDFVRKGVLYYYYADGNGKREHAAIGDARVSFSFVPDGPVSVLALQVGSGEAERDGFGPYRLIQRGWCGGLGEEEEKERLRQRSQLTTADLAKEAQMGSDGCLWCLCCACNLVNSCFAGALRPEIFHLFSGSRSLDACFESVGNETRAVKWGFRLVGWLMLFIGLYLTFSPILTFVKIIPWLGPLLSKLGAWLIWVLCLVLTLAIALVIICLAYLAYHPLMALMYSVIAAVVVCLPLMFLQKAG